MKNLSTETATFTATYKGKTASGKAIKLINCKQDKEDLFDTVYIPVSYIVNFAWKRKKDFVVSITIEGWLFDAKIDAYAEEQKLKQKVSSAMDQAEILIQTEERKRIETTDRLLKELDQENKF